MQRSQGETSAVYLRGEYVLLPEYPSPASQDALLQMGAKGSLYLERAGAAVAAREHGQGGNE